MFGETIQRAEFRDRAQLFFGQLNPPLEIIERLKSSALPFRDQRFAMLLPQTVHHAKSQSHGAVGNHRAKPGGFPRAHGQDPRPMPLRVFHDRGRRVKTHWLIVEQARIKLRRAMHLQIRASIREDREADRVRFRKSVKRKRGDRLQDLLDHVRRDLVPLHPRAQFHAHFPHPFLGAMKT